MSQTLKGRFTGMRPSPLDRVVQDFLSNQNEIPKVGLPKIREWIAAGAVAVDGHRQRGLERKVQPGSFVVLTVPPDHEAS